VQDGPQKQSGFVEGLKVLLGFLFAVLLLAVSAGCVYVAATHEPSSPQDELRGGMGVLAFLLACAATAVLCAVFRVNIG
jgi:hypothetical protein